MKSINKLREIASRLDDAAANVSEHGFSPIAIKASLLCDEIEAEIERDYMKLPADADGVLIHGGDRLECYANGYEGTFTVFAIGNDTVVGNHDIEWIRDNPYKWFHVASSCRHVKPRTLEDVLVDMLEDAIGYSDAHTDVALVAVEKYAEEIRELLGGDA